jgi:hypothetical protein
MRFEALVVGLCLLPLAAGAQPLSRVREGTLVRVETRDHDVFVGPIEKMRGDTLYLASYQKSPAIAVPSSMITGYSVSNGRDVARGMGRGVLVGGGIGLGLIAIARLTEGNSESMLPASAVAAAATVLLVVVGGVLGASDPPHLWVPATGFQVDGPAAIRSAPPSARLGVSLRF